MKRFATAWRCMLGLSIVGAGIAGVTAAAAATTLTVWCWDPNFNGGSMKEAAAIYTQSHPEVTINVVDTFTSGDLTTKLQAQLLSGSADGLPDITLVLDWSARKMLQAFPGAFAPLSDDIDMSKFAQYKVKPATLDGKSYSLPFDSGVSGLFYRSDYLAEAGYRADDLKNITWERMIEIGKDVLDKTGHQFLDLDFNNDGLIRIMMQSAGAWYFNPDGSLNILGNEPLKAALQVYQDMWQAGIVKPVNGWPNYTGAFTSGEVASVVVGVWMTGTLKANPDQAGKWAVASTPRLAAIPSSINASNQGGSSWFVLDSSPNKAEAIDFLKETWAKDVDFYQKILIDRGAVGTLLAASNGPAYSAKDEFFGGQQVWQDFSEWMSDIPPVDYGLYSAEVASAVQAQLPIIAKGGSIDDAMQAINDQVQGQIQ